MLSPQALSVCWTHLTGHRPRLCLHRTDYFSRLRNHINVADFEVVDAVEADGLYIFKRPVRAAAGQGRMLNQAGTVFHHVVLYIRATGKVSLILQTANALFAQCSSCIITTNPLKDGLVCAVPSKSSDMFWHSSLGNFVASASIDMPPKNAGSYL